MSIYDIPINRLDGTPADLHDYEGKAVAGRERRLEVRPHPAVRAASSSCTKNYDDRGFTVLGVPVQPVRRPGAGHRRGDPGVLLAPPTASTSR